MPQIYLNEETYTRGCLPFAKRPCVVRDVLSTVERTSRPRATGLHRLCILCLRGTVLNTLRPARYVI